MSFILDALRKSEAERQRGTTPGLADARLRPRSTVRSLWLPLLAVALLGNLLVLGFQWLRAPDDAAAPSDRAMPGETAPPASAPAAPELPGRPPVASTGEPARAVRPLARESATVSARAPMTGPEPARVPATAYAPEGSPNAVQVADASLPTADQLALAGVTLPRLNLELHVYSSDAANRFVFINTAKYREGARLREGPLVEAITSDGVVLDYEGRRFVLPRQ